jgi:peroxiredoxin
MTVAVNAADPEGCNCAGAPSFELQGTDGKSYTNSSFFGKPTVFVFINSNCGHAADSVSTLNKLSKSFGENARLVGVYSADIAQTKEFGAQNKVGFLLLADPDSKISQGFKAQYSLDFAYLCESDGKVIKMWNGLSRANVNALISEIRGHAGISLEVDMNSMPERALSGCPF